MSLSRIFLLRDIVVIMSKYQNREITKISAGQQILLGVSKIKVMLAMTRKKH